MSNGRGDARRGHGGRPGAAASAAERRVPEGDATRGDDHRAQRRGPPPSRGTPHGDAATTPGPPRRRPTDTHVSQEERDAAHDGDRASALRRGTLVPPIDARGTTLRAADWEGPPCHWDGRLFCGHDAMVPFTSTCAACFLWHEFRNTRLPCGHQPSDPYPTGCDVCRFYFEDLDERNGRPRRLACGQPAACPIMWGSCSHCFRAGHTHGTYDLLLRLRAHAGPPGTQLPVVHGAHGFARCGSRDARD